MSPSCSSSFFLSLQIISRCDGPTDRPRPPAYYGQFFGPPLMGPIALERKRRRKGGRPILRRAAKRVYFNAPAATAKRESKGRKWPAGLIKRLSKLNGPGSVRLHQSHSKNSLSSVFQAADRTENVPLPSFRPFRIAFNTLTGNSWPPFSFDFRPHALP